MVKARNIFEKYRGLYVAIVESKIVSYGKDAKKVLEKAKKKYPKSEIVLKKIPEEEALILSIA